MPNWEKFHVKMDSIHDEWNKSEEAIKAAEQVNGRVILPAVKELRYAGRRIVEALHLIGAGDDDHAPPCRARPCRVKSVDYRGAIFRPPILSGYFFGVCIFGFHDVTCVG